MALPKGKLVRDRVAARIRADGGSTYALNDAAEFTEALVTKLQEELQEYQEAGVDAARKEDAIEELADVLEVLFALAEHEHGAEDFHVLSNLHDAGWEFAAWSDETRALDKQIVLVNRLRLHLGWWHNACDDSDTAFAYLRDSAAIVLALAKYVHGVEADVVLNAGIEKNATHGAFHTRTFWLKP